VLLKAKDIGLLSIVFIAKAEIATVSVKSTGFTVLSGTGKRYLIIQTI
jgi:hypothetical protein